MQDHDISQCRARISKTSGKPRECRILAVPFQSEGEMPWRERRRTLDTVQMIKTQPPDPLFPRTGSANGSFNCRFAVHSDNHALADDHEGFLI